MSCEPRRQHATMTAAQQFDHSQLEVLSPASCLDLLGSVPLGRLVHTSGGLPAIRLVNFQLDGDTIVFGTGQGDPFRPAERGDVVAFEADAVDLDLCTGWTVTAIGHLSLAGPRLIRLAIESLHGRRLVRQSVPPV